MTSRQFTYAFSMFLFFTPTIEIRVNKVYMKSHSEVIRIPSEYVMISFGMEKSCISTSVFSKRLMYIKYSFTPSAQGGI